jgi:hypothetical protein
MGQIQVPDGFRNVSRLFRIEASGFTFSYRAEAAVTRADVASEHEGRSSV